MSSYDFEPSLKIRISWELLPQQHQWSHSWEFSLREVEILLEILTMLSPEAGGVSPGKTKSVFFLYYCEVLTNLKWEMVERTGTGKAGDWEHRNYRSFNIYFHEKRTAITLPGHRNIRNQMLTKYITQVWECRQK